MEPSSPELLSRVRQGDRQAAADLFTRYSRLIRQRCRARMRPGLRAVTDSEDVWATVTRRFDAMLARGGVSIASARDFWVLVAALTEHAIVDRARVLARLDRVRDDDEPFAERLRQRLVGRDGPPATDLDDLLAAVDDPTDRDILRLWLVDRSHAEIGAALGLSEGAVRSRWHQIRRMLRESLEGTPS